MLTEQKPHIGWRLHAEDLDPFWPKKGVYLDLPVQADQKRFDVWQALVCRELVAYREKVLALDDDTSLPRAESEAASKLQQIWPLLNLPPRVVAASRKRIFGAKPPVDEHDFWIHSKQELAIIAGVLWPHSHFRHEVIDMVTEANKKADRRAKVDRLFRDLEAGLD